MAGAKTEGAKGAEAPPRTFLFAALLGAGKGTSREGVDKSGFHPLKNLAAQGLVRVPEVVYLESN